MTKRQNSGDHTKGILYLTNSSSGDQVKKGETNNILTLALLPYDPALGDLVGYGNPNKIAPYYDGYYPKIRRKIMGYLPLDNESLHEFNFKINPEKVYSRIQTLGKNTTSLEDNLNTIDQITSLLREPGINQENKQPLEKELTQKINAAISLPDDNSPNDNPPTILITYSKPYFLKQINHKLSFIKVHFIFFPAYYLENEKLKGLIVILKELE